MTPRNTDISRLLYGVVDIFRKREKEFSISEIDRAWDDCEQRIKRAASRKAMRRRISIWSGAAAAAVILMLWLDGADLADTPGMTAIQDITTYALNTESAMTSGHIINMVPGCDTTVVDHNRASISCLAMVLFWSTDVLYPEPQIIRPPIDIASWRSRKDAGPRLSLLTAPASGQTPVRGWSILRSSRKTRVKYMCQARYILMSLPTKIIRL